MTDEGSDDFLVGCSDDQVNSLRGLRLLIGQNAEGRECQFWPVAQRLRVLLS